MKEAAAQLDQSSPAVVLGMVLHQNVLVLHLAYLMEAPVYYSLISVAYTC